MEYVLDKPMSCAKKYQKFTALDNLTMHIPKGAIYGFIGKTEPEKTTLSDFLCRIAAARHPGNFPLRNITFTATNQNARKRIGAVVETLPSIWT